MEQESDDILEKNFQRETEGLLDIKTFVSKRGELLKKQNVLGDVERMPVSMLARIKSALRVRAACPRCVSFRTGERLSVPQESSTKKSRR